MTPNHLNKFKKQLTPLEYQRLSESLVGYRKEFLSRDVAFILGIHNRDTARVKRQYKVKPTKVYDRDVYTREQLATMLEKRIQSKRPSFHKIMHLETHQKSALKAMQSVVWFIKQG